MTAVEAMVDGDGWISDESDFFGNHDMQYDLEDELDKESQLDTFWTIQHSLPANIALANREANKVDEKAAESVEEFLRSLPPSKCDASQHGPWLWVHGPKQAEFEPKGDGETLIESGSKLLDDFLKAKQSFESEGKAAQTVTKKLTRLRETLVNDLKQLAIQNNILYGKWLLFIPESNKLDEVWYKIGRAVIEGQLGPVAKVATEPNEQSRLICVYTPDCMDIKDVKRVLRGLIGLGVVGQRGIYYKSDLYTYLGIDSKNPYGLKASMYYSKTLSSS